MRTVSPRGTARDDAFGDSVEGDGNNLIHKEIFEMSVHFAGVVEAGLSTRPERNRFGTHRDGRRRMRLTRDLIAQVGRPVVDPGPLPDRVYTVDADYVAASRELLAGRPANGEVWVFAY